MSKKKNLEKLYLYFALEALSETKHFSQDKTELTTLLIDEVPIPCIDLFAVWNGSN